MRVNFQTVTDVALGEFAYIEEGRSESVTVFWNELRQCLQEAAQKSSQLLCDVIL